MTALTTFTAMIQTFKRVCGLYEIGSTRETHRNSLGSKLDAGAGDGDAEKGFLVAASTSRRVHESPRLRVPLSPRLRLPPSPCPLSCISQVGGLSSSLFSPG